MEKVFEASKWGMHFSLPEVREPFDKLCGIIFIEFDIREVHFDDRRRRISHPEEHQFRLPQMHWGQS